MCRYLSPSQASQLPQKSRSAFVLALAFASTTQVGFQAAVLLILIYPAPLTMMAERRHCAVGIPAWMPG
jgi:hypothetical protein